MPLDTTQPFREVRNAMGNVYREQAGIYYDVLGNTVSVPPFQSYAPMPGWLKPLVPQVVLQSSIPFILPGGTAGGGSNQFTVGNNGAISTIAATVVTYTLGAWMYMPAGAIFAGSNAGWYWFVGSSLTAGTLYNNTYISGDPKAVAPVTPTPFSTTGPGLVTQTAATNIDALQVTIPGGLFGPNGSLVVDEMYIVTNNANAKTAYQNFGGIPTGSGLGSATGRRILRKFKTMNNPSAIKFSNGWQPTTDGSIGAYPNNNGLINTNVDQPYKVTFNLAAATDTAVLEWCDIQTTYGS